MADRQETRNAHPDSWVAVNEGDTIYGNVTDVTEAWSDQRNNGSWYPLLTIGNIQEATGYDVGVAELKVHCFGSVLYNEVMRHRPEVGEKVRITFRGVGEAKKRGQSPPALYTMRVEGRKDQAQRAYARIAGEAPGAPARGPSAARQPDPETDENSTDDIPF